MNILVVTPSQGHYGGMEGFVIDLASKIKAWPEFEVQLCFKLVGGRELKSDLKEMASAANWVTCWFHTRRFRKLRD